MKKNIILFGFGLATLLLFSCKKDWTCECSYEILGEKITETIEMKNLPKKGAEENCALSIPNVEDYECNLK